MQETRVEYGGKALPEVTVSIEVAAMSTRHADCELLLKSADGALYRAKKKGRNRVESEFDASRLDTTKRLSGRPGRFNPVLLCGGHPRRPVGQGKDHARGTIPAGLLLGGVLADRVFEPFMQMVSPVQSVLSFLVGAGKGSGMAIIFLLTGIAGTWASLRRLWDPMCRELDE